MDHTEEMSVEQACEIERGPDGKRKLAELHGIEFSSRTGQPQFDDCCDDPECLMCGIIACPDGEPLHFHHDGCPAFCSGNVTFPKPEGAPGIAHNFTSNNADDH